MVKKIAAFICVVIALTASQALADKINLTTLPTEQAGGYYVGAMGGSLNGGTSANYYCIDFVTTTSVPSSFKVLVSTLSDISGTKFADQMNALKKYQQVGWLMYEMEINPTKVADLQFAMWSVFNPSTPTYGDSAYWLDASTKINAADYDFSKMRIYTATNTRNQELMGGSVSAAAPEPGEWVLIVLGMCLIAYSMSNQRGKSILARSVR